jgi:putative membrane protein
MKRTLFLAAAALLAAAPGALAQASITTPPDAKTTPAEPIEKIDTATFTRMAASSNAFEIESSKLATQSSASEAVKQFAQQMIADHTRAGQDFKAALESVEITSSVSGPALQPKEQQALDALKATSGDQFEKAYVAAQVEAHGEAVAVFHNYANSGDDPALKEFAKKTLPVLEMHLEHAKELQARG